MFTSSGNVWLTTRRACDVAQSAQVGFKRVLLIRTPSIEHRLPAPGSIVSITVKI
jgi:hypothetical protein